jgi:AraC family transcriptional activator of pobA
MSVSEIRHEILNLQNDSEHLLRSLLYYLLIKTNRLYSDSYKINNTTVKNINILKFQQLLEKNIRKKHNVNEYAQDLNISRTYLNLQKDISTKLQTKLLKNTCLPKQNKR